MLFLSLSILILMLHFAQPVLILSDSQAWHACSMAGLIQAHVCVPPPQGPRWVAPLVSHPPRKATLHHPPSKKAKSRGRGCSCASGLFFFLPSSFLSEFSVFGRLQSLCHSAFSWVSAHSSLSASFHPLTSFWSSTFDHSLGLHLPSLLFDPFPSLLATVVFVL